jgi:hypothetical protein
MNNDDIAKWIRESTDMILEIADKCRDYETIFHIQNKSISALAQRIIALEKEHNKLMKEIENISLMN